MTREILVGEWRISVLDFALSIFFSRCYVRDITSMKLLFLCSVYCAMFEVPAGTSVYKLQYSSCSIHYN